MHRILLVLLLAPFAIYALHCNVSQIHIAQGLDYKTMTISWLTPDQCLSQVIYWKSSTQVKRVMQGMSSFYEFYYKKAEGMNYYRSGYIHHVTLLGLEHSTEYNYHCGDFDENTFSKLLTFKTLPKPGDNTRLTFGVIGDIGQTIHSISTVTHLINERNISMILHAGDLSYADCDQTLWDSYGEMIEPLAAYTPWMVCPGNHEIEFNGTDYTNLFTAFEHRYRMPYFKPASFGDVIIKSSVNPKTGMPYCTPSIFQTEYNFGNSFFSFDNGLAHIIYLNPYTNSSITSFQYKWLLDNLREIDRKATPWIIVVMHCPWYSSNTNHYADPQTVQMRESMEELFYKYNVNLVFNGHVHDYERTYPVFQNVTDNYGTVYITIGNSGNLEGLDNHYYQQPKWSAFRNGTEYGYGTFTIIDKTRSYWKWYVNNGKQMIPRDELLLRNSLF